MTSLGTRQVTWQILLLPLKETINSISIHMPSLYINRILYSTTELTKQLVHKYVYEIRVYVYLTMVIRNRFSEIFEKTYFQYQYYV